MASMAAQSTLMPSIAVIPARGGSRGLPRKAEAEVAGVPLLVRTIRAALGARSVGRVVVSTDDQRYADLARKHGADIPFLRDPSLASDTSSIRDVVEDLLRRICRHGLAPVSMVLLQPTSPFTRSSDIDQAFALLNDCDAVASVCESDVQPDWLRQTNEEGWLAPIAQLAVPQHTARQAMPTVFRLNGAIYWVRLDSFARERTFLPRRTRAYCMPRERSVDIDTPADLALARWLADTQLEHHQVESTDHVPSCPDYR